MNDTQSTKPLVLIDMDLTTVDWDPFLNIELQRILPKDVYANRNTIEYFMQKQFGEEYTKIIDEIMLSQGFFLNLPPMEGAIEAIQQMLDEGLQLTICSKPLDGSTFCIPEKLEWLEKYLGKGFAETAKFPPDKTTEHGDILIDDRTDLLEEGEHTPTWTQIVFDSYHNRHIEVSYRLTNWRQWKEIVLPVIEHKLKSPR